ncbi:MAG: flagellar basal body protein [Gracilibacteraceae bacterium]|jgi:flagellar hook-associated protein 1 FlgK|nr:flagellar basal body protein [Gracilibacteraceae bacterium]
MVRATFQGMYTSLSGIIASQANLDVTAQNLTNILTTGYTRQRADLLAIGDAGLYSHIANPQAIHIGQGVNVFNTSQLRNAGYDLRYREENTKYGYYETRLSGLDDLERVLDEISRSESGGGIQDQLLSFLDSLNGIADKASDKDYSVIARNEAAKITQLLNEQSRELQKIYDQQYEDFSVTVGKINTLLKSVSELDKMIHKDETYGNSSHELKDMRNVLLDELAGYLPIEYTPTAYSDDMVKLMRDTLPHENDPYPNAADNIEYSVSIVTYDATGAKVLLPLVQNNGNYVTLNLEKYTAYSGETLPRLKLDYPTPSGMYEPGDPTSPMDGQSYSLTADQLDPVSLPTDATLKVAVTSGSVGGYLDLLSGDGNFGTAEADNYGVRYYQKMIDAFAQTFANELNGINTNPTPPPTWPALFTTDDGVTTTGITAGNISVSTAWNADAGALKTTAVATPLGEENDKILEMIALFDSKNINFSGTDISGTPITLYTGGIVSYHANLGVTLGIDKNTVSNLSATYKLNVDNLDSYRQSVSGVDENEEAANMLMYQKAYSAAARILTAMDEMLDLVVNRMGIVGR